MTSLGAWNDVVGGAGMTSKGSAGVALIGKWLEAF